MWFGEGICSCNGKNNRECEKYFEGSETRNSFLREKDTVYVERTNVPVGLEWPRYGWWRFGNKACSQVPLFRWKSRKTVQSADKVCADSNLYIGVMFLGSTKGQWDAIVLSVFYRGLYIPPFLGSKKSICLYICFYVASHLCQWTLCVTELAGW